MKISLITVCRNCAATLPTALESVARQRGADIEYVVVDGGSTDGTDRLLRSFESRFRDAGIAFRWMSEPDKGMYDAINKGVALASGDVVGILNADDVLASDGILSNVAGAFDDTVDAIYADIRFVRDERPGQTSLGELRDRPTARYYSARRWLPSWRAAASTAPLPTTARKPRTTAKAARWWAHRSPGACSSWTM